MPAVLGGRSAMDDQAVTVAGPLRAPVPPVLHLLGHPAPRHPQPRQDDRLVGPDGPYLRVLDITRSDIVDTSPSCFHPGVSITSICVYSWNNVSVMT